MIKKLVLLISFLIFLPPVIMAKPHDHAPDPTVEGGDSENENTKHDLNQEDVNITKVTERPQAAIEQEFYPYRQSISPRLGFLLSSDDPTSIDFLFGVNYLFPSYESPFIEAGIDVTSNSLGIIHVTRRYIMNQHRYFRPYFKYGLAHFVDPDKEFGSFLSIENYYLRGVGGIEDLLDKPWSARLELEFSIGTTASYISINVGSSYGF